MRRLKIPRTFDVRGKRWRVALGDRYHGVTLMKDREVILLDSSQPLREQWDTWVHELLHACWPPGIVSQATEERVVAKMAKDVSRALHATVRLNIKAGK